MKSNHKVIVLILTLAALTVGTPAGEAQTFSVIYNFSFQDGAYPTAALTVDKNDILYGTAQKGGTYNHGTVFQLRQSNSVWKLTTLHNFAGDNDGAAPYRKVVFGPNGYLYGTTIGGGGGCVGFGGCGTVFRLTPPGPCRQAPCGYSVLYRFTGGADGWYVIGEPALDSAGNIYGTTAQGGNGTVWELSPAGSGWTFQTLYRFGTNIPDVDAPESGVTIGPDGKLYGTGFVGGAHDQGGVFQLSRNGNTWTEKLIYSFLGGDDGGEPFGGLIFDSAGNLYGTTSNQGMHNGGTAFMLSDNFSYSLLYGFTAINQEEGPQDKLVMDSAGNLYGTINQGGGLGAGAVFKLTPSNGLWTYTLLHEFTQSDGVFPTGGLVFDSHGNLYGMTQEGGNYNLGVVYEITPN